MTTTYQNIRTTILRAKKRINTVVHHTIVETYWQIGKYIVEEEQSGKNRATYGKALIVNLAEKLKEEFGSGYDRSNLLRMKNFYRLFPILDALRQELSWMHCHLLLRLKMRTHDNYRNDYHKLINNQKS